MTDKDVGAWLVSRAYNLRMNAIIQQQAISLGGNIAYLDGQTGTAAPVVPSGNGGARGADRTWEILAARSRDRLRRSERALIW